MADDPTAIRHPKRGKAHRLIPLQTTVWTARQYRNGHETTACKPSMLDALKGLTERVPLSQVVPAERCKTCWPTTKEAGQ